MRRQKKLQFTICFLAILLASCNKYESNVHAPSYIHLDSICISNDPSHSISNQEGFFTSDIDAVQLELWFEGDKVTTQLGTYPLPCTVPVLDNRPIQKIQVYPFVKINGIAGTRGYYPFYEFAIQNNVPLATDSTTNLGTLDPETGRYYYNLHYQRGTKVLKQEFFEPQQYNIIFDSVVEWIKHDNTLAACGEGCGHVHIDANCSDTTFMTTGYLEETNPTSYLYLEIEYKSSVEVAVGLHSARSVGGIEETYGVMNLYPTDQWRKEYISLGKTWRWFNYNPNFKLVFTLLNIEAEEGDLYIDNVKVVSY